MIYKFQPFSIKKQIGEEYNAHCSIVPNPEDWILILDYDTLILDFRAYALMELAIENNPQVEIFGAYTNRIGYPFQRYSGLIEEEDSVRFHVERAVNQIDLFPNGEIREIPTAAGFFLLFQKKYWQENKFQDQILYPRCFDHVFCDSAMRRNSIALIKGIYVWHTYRLMHKNNRNIKHLKV